MLISETQNRSIAQIIQAKNVKMFLGLFLHKGLKEKIVLFINSVASMARFAASWQVNRRISQIF
jgi:hypothetical protein